MVLDLEVTVIPVGVSVGDLRSVTTQLEVVEWSPPSDVKLREKWTRLVQGESARRVARVNRRLLSGS